MNDEGEEEGAVLAGGRSCRSAAISLGVGGGAHHNYPCVGILCACEANLLALALTLALIRIWVKANNKNSNLEGSSSTQLFTCVSLVLFRDHTVPCFSVCFGCAIHKHVQQRSLRSLF